MTRFKRFSIVFALSGYVLATVGIHMLHDHSAAGPLAHHAAQVGAHLHAGHSHAGHSHSHSGHSHAGHSYAAHVQAGHAPATAERSPANPSCPSGDCEDTCSACRLLAVKSIAPAIVTFGEFVAALCPIESPPTHAAPRTFPALPLSRGPPCA